MTESLLIQVLKTKKIINISSSHPVIKNIEKIIINWYKEYYKMKDEPDPNLRKELYAHSVRNNILRLARIGPKYKAIIYANMFTWLYNPDYISKLF